jgi:hypothetical protein
MRNRHFFILYLYLLSLLSLGIINYTSINQFPVLRTLILCLRALDLVITVDTWLLDFRIDPRNLSLFRLSSRLVRS